MQALKYNNHAIDRNRNRTSATPKIKNYFLFRNCNIKYAQNNGFTFSSLNNTTKRILYECGQFNHNSK